MGRGRGRSVLSGENGLAANGRGISPVKNREQHRSKPFFPVLSSAGLQPGLAKTGSNVIGFFPDFIVRIREHRRRRREPCR